MRASGPIYSAFVVLLVVLLGSDNGESLSDYLPGEKLKWLKFPSYISSAFPTNQGQHVHPDQWGALYPAVERNARNGVQFKAGRIRWRSVLYSFGGLKILTNCCLAFLYCYARFHRFNIPTPTSCVSLILLSSVIRGKHQNVKTWSKKKRKIDPNETHLASVCASGSAEE